MSSFVCSHCTTQMEDKILCMLALVSPALMYKSLKAKKNDARFCRLLFGMYIVFLFLFTTGLSLAAQSPNPRSYTSPRDFVRLFILEIVCLLYILVVLGGDLILFM